MRTGRKRRGGCVRCVRRGVRSVGSGATPPPPSVSRAGQGGPHATCSVWSSRRTLGPVCVIQRLPGARLRRGGRSMGLPSARLAWARRRRAGCWRDTIRPRSTRRCCRTSRSCCLRRPSAGTAARARAWSPRRTTPCARRRSRLRPLVGRRAARGFRRFAAAGPRGRPGLCWRSGGQAGRPSTSAIHPSSPFISRAARRPTDARRDGEARGMAALRASQRASEPGRRASADEAAARALDRHLNGDRGGDAHPQEREQQQLPTRQGL